MSEEQAVEVIEAAEPAQEVEATAAETTEEVQPPEEKEEAQQEEERKFTQKELDEIVSKRLDRERRKAERLQQPGPKVQQLAPDQFKSLEEYATARAEQLVAEKLMQEQHRRTVDKYTDLEEQARDKYTDFEAVAYNPNLSISDVMAQTIQQSEVGPEVAYYLGKNPKEAQRIANLSPLLQAREIGKIESRVEQAPSKPVKPSSAPDPIKPIGAKSAAPTNELSKMTMDEYLAARQKQGARWSRR